MHLYYVAIQQFIPIVIGALCTVTKGLIKGLEDLGIRGRVETIQTTALQETEVWPYEQMLYKQLRICLVEWDAQIPLEVWDTNRSPNIGLMTRFCNNQQERKRTHRNINFAVPADHWVKLKENENRDTYIDLAKELKKLWNMKVTVMPIVISPFGTLT